MLLGSSPRNTPRCFCDASSQPMLTPVKFRAYVICPRQFSRRLWAPNAAACGAQAVPSADQPPALATQEHVEKWHGQKRRDEYNWLSKLGPTHPEVLSYLKAESQYTLSKLAHTRQLQLDLQDSLQAWSNARKATDSHHEQQQQQQETQTTASASYSAIQKHKFAVHPDWLAGQGLLQYKQCTSFRWPGFIVGQYRFFSVPASSSTTALMHCRVAAAAAVSDTAADAYVSGTDADVITGGALPSGSVILWDESGSSSSSSSGGGTAASSSSSVHSIAVSPCGKYVAVTYSYDNGRTYTLSVIDSSTGDALLQPVRDVDGPIVWVTQAAQPAAAAAAAAAANTDATNPTTAQHAKELQQHQQQIQQYLLYVTDDYREVQCLTVSSSSSSTTQEAAAAAAANNHLPVAAPCSIFRDPQHVSLDISSVDNNTFITVFGADGLIRQVLYYNSSSSSDEDDSSSSHVQCTPNQAEAWHVLLPAAAVAECLQQEQALTHHNLVNSPKAECITDNLAAAAAAAITAAGDDDPTVRLAVTVNDDLLFVRRSCAVIPQGQMFVAQLPSKQQQQQQQELHWQMLLPAQEEFCLEAAFISNASFSSNANDGGSSKHLQLLVLGWRHHTWQQQQQQQQQQQSSTDLQSGTIATCRRLELQLYDLHSEDCCQQQQQQQQLVTQMQQRYACEVPMPDAFYEVHDAVWYPAQHKLQIDFSSIVRPRSRLTLDLSQQQQQETAPGDSNAAYSSAAAAAAAGYKLELLQAVPDSFDQSCYDTLHIGVPALRNINNDDDDDDVIIPLSLAYKKQAAVLPDTILALQQQQQQQGYDKLAPQTSNPSAAAAAQCKVLLTCYGSYGICEHVHFNAELLQLLDGGWVVAVAHVRGGGWLGRSWAEAGRGLAKSNSVTDLLSVTKYIHESGLCSPQGLIVQGSSAGGWLAAAAALQQPSLFAAAVLTVPCLDPLGLLLHEQQGELELGDAATDAQVYDSIRSWAPYDLLERMLYPETQQQQQSVTSPHMLIRAALNDQEVPISNVVKTVARLRRLADTSRRRAIHSGVPALGQMSPGGQAKGFHSSLSDSSDAPKQQQQPQHLLLRVIPGGHLAYEGFERESALKLAFMMSVVR